jgi:hypothetical protein
MRAGSNTGREWQSDEGSGCDQRSYFLRALSYAPLTFQYISS